MINVNELRIGNWVNFDDQSQRVDEIISGSVCFQQGFRQVNVLSISPIALNRDIIAKAGFSNASSQHWIQNELVLTDSTDNKDGFIFYYENDLFINAKLMISVKSLHQLQNLYFALLGEELDIIL